MDIRREKQKAGIPAWEKSDLLKLGNHGSVLKGFFTLVGGGCHLANVTNIIKKPPKSDF